MRQLCERSRFRVARWSMSGVERRRLHHGGLILAICYASICVGGCEWLKSPSRPSGEPVVLSLAIRGESPAAVGQTSQLSAYVRMSDGTEVVAVDGVTWSTSNSAVVTVSDTGLVAAQAIGTAVVSAAYKERRGDVAVHVTKASPRVVSLHISGQTNLVSGTSSQLNALARDPSGQEQDVTAVAAWSSADANVASVSARGVVTAIAVGTTRITASFESVSDAVDIAISAVPTPPEIRRVVVTGPSNLTAGVAQQFVAKAEWSDGSSQDVTSEAEWISANPLVATAASSGLVRAIAPGTSTISAVYHDHSGSAVLIVSTASVSDLIVSGPTSLTIGATGQMIATAKLSDGSQAAVTALATWQSSNPAVLTINGSGIVTAIAPGTAGVTATYEGRSAALTVTVVVGGGGPSGGQVRMLYVYPRDRAVRQDYLAAIQTAFRDLQSWFASQLGGPTFTVATPQPQLCQLPQDAAFYAVDSWSKVMSDVQGCAPVSWHSQSTTWALYVDIVHACNAPGRLGAGGDGVLMLPRQDMDGLVGARYLDDCGVEYNLPPSRYVGGAGHELGHAFGLPHPPGCEQGAPTCDTNALMWLGYAAYPNTYLRPEEKALLLSTPFFR